MARKPLAEIESKDAQTPQNRAQAQLHGGTAPTGTDTPEGAHRPSQRLTEGQRREAEYIAAMRKNIDNPDALSYLHRRGFLLEDAMEAGIGYDPTKRRLVLPWRGCEWYHIDRAIDDATEPKYTKPKTEAVGAQPLYNPDAVTEQAFFVVEGVLDAIAVQLCGFEAVALGSCNMSADNLTALKAKADAGGGSGVAILMLDNDKSGTEGAERLYEAFEGMGVACLKDDAGLQHKDAAEWLEVDRDGLCDFLEDRHAKAVTNATAMREASFRQALRNLRVINPFEVACDVYDLADAEEPTPTGIDGLDNVLDGGLRSGLYALGAVSSMGKTTFAVQVADNLAEQGRGVLFVTIEQSAREIVAKSLSRYAYRLAGVTISATEAVSRSRRERWGNRTYDALGKACEHYGTSVAPRLRILEGTSQPSVADVLQVAQLMTEHDGRAPAIFIDYLQLLAPLNDKYNDKQATDRNVSALRQLARDLKAPVFVISSLNRSSYGEGVTMDAWKESGAIEYGCDVLLGLQPRGIRDIIDAAKDARARREADRAIRIVKAGDVRSCELVVLKNRNGRTPYDGIPLKFKPLLALYEEDDTDSETITI